jgi:hypothetical protein
VGGQCSADCDCASGFCVDQGTAKVCVAT